MTTYIKLPNNWFVAVPMSLLAEYSIVQMYLDHDGFVSTIQGICCGDLLFCSDLNIICYMMLSILNDLFQDLDQ